jgi:hypothetical protein
METKKEVVGVEKYRTGKLSIKTLSPFSVVPIGSGTELDDCDSAIVGRMVIFRRNKKAISRKRKICCS